jgi:hypothetical protein
VQGGFAGVSSWMPTAFFAHLVVGDRNGQSDFAHSP